MNYSGSTEDQAYTITDGSKSYTVPAFEVVPSHCQLTYSLEVSPGEGSSAVSFEADTELIFTFFNEDDVSLAGSDSKEY